MTATHSAFLGGLFSPPPRVSHLSGLKLSRFTDPPHHHHHHHHHDPLPPPPPPPSPNKHATITRSRNTHKRANTYPLESHPANTTSTTSITPPRRAASLSIRPSRFLLPPLLLLLLPPPPPPPCRQERRGEERRGEERRGPRGSEVLGISSYFRFSSFMKLKLIQLDNQRHKLTPVVS